MRWPEEPSSGAAPRRAPSGFGPAILDGRCWNWVKANLSFPGNVLDCLSAAREGTEPASFTSLTRRGAGQRWIFPESNHHARAMLQSGQLKTLMEEDFWTHSRKRQAERATCCTGSKGALPREVNGSVWFTVIIFLNSNTNDNFLWHLLSNNGTLCIQKRERAKALRQGHGVHSLWLWWVEMQGENVSWTGHSHRSQVISKRSLCFKLKHEKIPPKGRKGEVWKREQKQKEAKRGKKGHAWETRKAEMGRSLDWEWGGGFLQPRELKE